MLFGPKRVNLKVSSGAVGCTEQYQSVRGEPEGYENLYLRIVDTAGLGESSEGTVPNEEAITMLEDKLKSLHDTDGIHLILFCIRKGRRGQTTTQNYQGIVHELCENQVPCVLVITCCEDDEPLGEWWEENKTVLRNQLKLDVIDAVAVTAINNDETSADYEESRKRLIEAIVKYSLKKPWKIHGVRQKLRSLFDKQANRSAILRPKKTELDKHLQRPMDESKPASSFFSRWFSGQNRE